MVWPSESVRQAAMEGFAQRKTNQLGWKIFGGGVLLGGFLLIIRLRRTPVTRRLRIAVNWPGRMPTPSEQIMLKELSRSNETQEAQKVRKVFQSLKEGNPDEEIFHLNWNIQVLDGRVTGLACFVVPAINTIFVSDKIIAVLLSVVNDRNVQYVINTGAISPGQVRNRQRNKFSNSLLEDMRGDVIIRPEMSLSETNGDVIEENDAIKSKVAGVSSIIQNIPTSNDPNSSNFASTTPNSSTNAEFDDVFESPLAFVMAHELSHVICKHDQDAFGVEMFVQGIIFGIGVFFGWCLASLPSSIAASSSPEDSNRRQVGFFDIIHVAITCIVVICFTVVFIQMVVALPVARKLEKEADVVGMMLATKAGFKPEGMPYAFTILPDVPAWVSTHPTSTSRSRLLRNFVPWAQIIGS